jgi:hypothetical protein
MVAYVNVEPLTRWTDTPETMHGELQASGSNLYKNGTSANSYVNTQATSGQRRWRFYEGVKVTFVSATESEYAFFSWWDLMMSLAILQVYFGMAGGFMVLFSTMLLGNVSRNIKRGSVKELRIQDQVQKVRKNHFEDFFFKILSEYQK